MSFSTLKCLKRLEQGTPVRRVSIPFISIHQKPGDLPGFLEAHITEANSYKSFIAPDKLGEALSCFIDSPWAKVASVMAITEADAKSRLRVIADWRNRIVHEADVNPNLGGIELWPIVRSDVIGALDELARLARAVRLVVENS